GGALHLDEGAGAGDHDVHVGLGADVLAVLEVQQRPAVHDADADGRDGVGQDRAGCGEGGVPLAPGDRVGQGDVGAGDGGGAGAAIGLQDVAVQLDGVLPQRVEVDHGPQGAPDQPGDLVGAAPDPALDALPGRAGG